MTPKRLRALLPPGAAFKLGQRAPRLAPTLERLMRRARTVGPGEAPGAAVEQVERAVDVLIVGGGMAGLAAAAAAQAAGLGVLLAERNERLGGIADAYDGTIDGRPLAAFLAAEEAALAAARGVEIAKGAAVAVLDRGLALLVEPDAGRLWRVAPRAVVLATGAAETPLAFPGNDRPGIGLAVAARLALRRDGWRPQGRIVVAATSDEGYRTALDLQNRGIAVERIVDLRLEPDGPMAYIARAHGIRMALGSAPVALRTGSGGRLSAVIVANRFTVDDVALSQTIACDTLLVSAGWSPELALAAQAGAEIAFADGTLRTAALPPWLFVAGAAAGRFNLGEVLADGWRAGAAAAAHLGGAPPPAPTWDVAVTADPAPETVGPQPADVGPRRQMQIRIDRRARVSLRDIAVTLQEGYRAPAQLARYAGLGRHGTDAATATLAAAAVASLGGDAAMPPAWPGEPTVPLDLAALAGARRGAAAFAHRDGPLGPPAAGVPLAAVAGWRLPLAFPRAGEEIEAAIRREVAATRATAGLADLSARGRIAVTGPGARAFLDHVLATDLSALAAGGALAVVALDDDGFVRAAGELLAFADDRFLLCAPPEATARWSRWLARRRAAWQGPAVALLDETARWGAVWIGGPGIAELLHDLADGAGSRPASGVVWQGHVAGAEAFALPHATTGDAAVEVALAAAALPSLWQRLSARANAAGGAVIGTGAWHRLHLEAGAPDAVRDGSGTTTASDLGLAALVGTKDAFVGRAGLARPALAAADRPTLAGLLPQGAAAPPPGTLLLAGRDGAAARAVVGRVTRSGYSPTAQRPLAIGLVADAAPRTGETVFFRLSGELRPALVVPPQRLGLGAANGLLRPATRADNGQL